MCVCVCVCVYLSISSTEGRKCEREEGRGRKRGREEERKKREIKLSLSFQRQNPHRESDGQFHITLEDTTLGTFRALLEFIYTGNVRSFRPSSAQVVGQSCFLLTLFLNTFILF